MTFGWKREEDDKHLLHNTVPHTETPVTEPVPVSINDFVPQPQEYIPEEEIKQTHTEEVPSETPLTALGGDITATEEKPVETVEDIPLEQWNKMIEEAEQAIQQEKQEIIEAEAQKYIPENYSAVTGDRIKPDFTEVIEPEDSKKKTYMTKDETRHIQVKNRS